MKDSLITVRLMDVVSGTSTNADGFALFTAIDKYLSENIKTRLSLDGATPLSTSFLNSSIGSLADKYGLDDMRKKIVFTNLTTPQINTLKRYFELISC